MPNHRYWRILVSGTCSLGVVYVGQLTEVPRPIYEGYRPIRWADKSDIRPRSSANGHYLGRSIYRRGKQGRIRVTNVPADWFRDNDSSIQSLRTDPFFLWWRPDGYSDEVEYCWTESPPEVENTGPRGLMSLGLAVSAYAS